MTQQKYSTQFKEVEEIAKFQEYTYCLIMYSFLNAYLSSSSSAKAEQLCTELREGSDCLMIIIGFTVAFFEEAVHSMSRQH